MYLLDGRMDVAHWTVIRFERGFWTNQHANKFLNWIVLENYLAAKTCAFICIVTESLYIANFFGVKVSGKAEYETNICTRVSSEWTLSSSLS